MQVQGQGGEGWASEPGGKEATRSVPLHLPHLGELFSYLFSLFGPYRISTETMERVFTIGQKFEFILRGHFDD